MAIKLDNVQEPTAQGETLREIERVTHGTGKGAKVLAVAETGTGDLVLTVERTRGEKHERAGEKYLKRTSRLADVAHAIEAGLLAA